MRLRRHVQHLIIEGMSTSYLVPFRHLVVYAVTVAVLWVFNSKVPFQIHALGIHLRFDTVSHFAVLAVDLDGCERDSLHVRSYNNVLEVSATA